MNELKQKIVEDALSTLKMAQMKALTEKKAEERRIKDRETAARLKAEQAEEMKSNPSGMSEFQKDDLDSGWGRGTAIKREEDSPMKPNRERKAFGDDGEGLVRSDKPSFRNNAIRGNRGGSLKTEESDNKPPSFTRGPPRKKDGEGEGPTSSGLGFRNTNRGGKK